MKSRYWCGSPHETPRATGPPPEMNDSVAPYLPVDGHPRCRRTYFFHHILGSERRACTGSSRATRDAPMRIGFAHNKIPHHYAFRRAMVQRYILYMRSLAAPGGVFYHLKSCPTVRVTVDSLPPLGEIVCNAEAQRAGPASVFKLSFPFAV